MTMTNSQLGAEGARVPVASLHRRTQIHKIAIEEAISRVLERSHFVLGGEVLAFEKSFADYIGTKYSVGVANGTDAIELGLRALGVQPGDRVATVANAGNYSATAILAIGAVPFYMDVEKSTRNVSFSEIQKALENGVRAVIVTHLYGLAVTEIQEIAKVCKSASVGLLEDCAQAHGAEVAGRKVGSYGDIGSFSFYPTKNLGALGDGGALTTSNELLADKVRKLRAYGWGEKYSVTLAGGRNSRLDEIQAAILLTLLPFLDESNEARRKIARSYNDEITDRSLQLPEYISKEYVGHLFVITTPRRDEFISKLNLHGIDTAIHYPISDHRQSILGSSYLGISLPVTEELTEQIVTIPCFSEMSNLEIQRTISAINS